MSFDVTDNWIQNLPFLNFIILEQSKNTSIRLCGISPAFEEKENLTIMQGTTRSIAYLVTLELLWIKEIYAATNTKDAYWSRELTIKL